MLVRTCQSNIHVAQAARTRAFRNGELLRAPRRLLREPGYIGQEFDVQLGQGETLVLEKLASFYTSRDHAIAVVLLNAVMGCIQQSRAEQAVAALRQMSATCGRVSATGGRGRTACSTS